MFHLYINIIQLICRNISSDASPMMMMTADNQTVIIYTVFVNRIPVLATIAANDMKLMSQNEVSKILDKSILTKAERMSLLTCNQLNILLTHRTSSQHNI